jgi:ATP-dependent Clp protease ATP-binding subunit ClpB
MTSNLRHDTQLRDFFRPEFVNRIDDIVNFDPLTEADIRRIVDIQLRALSDRLTDRRIALDVTAEARDHLATIGYDPAFGARPLKRVIQKELGDRLALAILEGGYADGDTVTVAVKDDELTFS